MEKRNNKLVHYLAKMFYVLYEAVPVLLAQLIIPAFIISILWNYSIVNVFVGAKQISYIDTLSFVLISRLLFNVGSLSIKKKEDK